MRLYRTILVWVLRLFSVAQLMLAAFVLASLVNIGGGDQISGPLAVLERDPVEQVIAALLGPVVCLAIAEALALLNSRNTDHAR